jgi:alkanesulfonate monooxygenase SsuD/methylene tetrahydromethanopterin reductase-like flavin-dependent oxidoreductase (luciferase family)
MSAAAEAAGRRPDEITCAANLIVEFTPNGPSASLNGQRITGHREAIAERLIAIGRTGFTVLNVALADAEERRRFAAEVMPLVREGQGMP